MAILPGCTDVGNESNSKQCIGCSLDLIKALLFAKYIPDGSRLCDQYAVIAGCGCSNDKGVGFVKSLKILNPPDPTLVCSTSGKLRPRFAKFSCPN